VGIAFSVLWGTLFPILSEAVRGTKITVGPPFFNRVNVPLGILLLALTGIGPLIAWRKASIANVRRQFVTPGIAGLVTLGALFAAGLRNGYSLIALGIAGFVLATVVQEFWRGIRARGRLYGESVPAALGQLVGRNRRRYGGYIVHVGIVVYFVAFVGSAFRTTQQVTLRPGESVAVKSAFGSTYSLTFRSVSQYQDQNRLASAALLDVARDGKPLGAIKSEKRQYVDSFGRPTFQPSTEVGLLGGIREDVYVVYAGSVDGTERSSFTVHVNPLVWWIWFGGLILVVGGLITMWPGGWQAAPVTRLAPARESIEVPA
jgi:cytochrome c-type biogenesis protein CcmF